MSPAPRSTPRFTRSAPALFSSVPTPIPSLPSPAAPAPAPARRAPRTRRAFGAGAALAPSEQFPPFDTGAGGGGLFGVTINASLNGVPSVSDAENTLGLLHWGPSSGGVWSMRRSTPRPRAL